ncbi:hypothetical protein ACN47E_004302 [Coniothyrium glycines]
MRILGLIGLIVAVWVTAEAPRHQSYPRDLLFNFTDTASGFEGAAFSTKTPPPPSRPLPPLPPNRSRPQLASDALWSTCARKGCALESAMWSSDEVAGSAYSPPRPNAQSPFRSQSDMQKWFWWSFPPERVDPTFDDFYGPKWGIGWALVALGVNPFSSSYEGGKNDVFFIDHQSFDAQAPDVNLQEYTVDGRRYRATGASYSFTINADEGVIMGLNRKSPRYAAQERNPPVSGDQLPGLNQFSDIAWIGWDVMSKQKKRDVKDLRYLISVGISNDDTRAVIQRALFARGWALSEFPGHTFERASEEFGALIGTPNLQGFAYLLIQHKDRLGDMLIDRVQIFHGETTHQNPCVVMHVAQLQSQVEVGPRDVAENVIFRRELGGAKL